MTTINIIKDMPRPPEKVRKLTLGVNDLLTVEPHIAAELQEIDPTTVLAGSTKKVLWKCSLCSNTWETAPRSRTQSYRPEPGCPDCSRKKALKLRSANKKLADVYPDLAQELLNPEDAKEVSYSSHEDLIWICDRNHEYTMSVNKRVNGRNCEYCNFRSILVGFNDLTGTAPHLVEELVQPELATQYLANSKENLDWKHTAEDGLIHYWSATMNNRVYFGTGCLVCDGKLVQPGINDFGSQFLGESGLTWHDTNELSPESITLGSNKNILLSCDNHATPNIMKDKAKYFSNGRRKCQDCIPTDERFTSKAEYTIVTHLRDKFPNAKVEHTVRRFKSNGVSEIDILVDDWFAIDFNGEYWHQEGVYKPFGYHQKKRDCIAAIGFIFVEVWETQWLADQDKILQDLANRLYDGKQASVENPPVMTDIEAVLKKSPTIGNPNAFYAQKEQM